MKKILLPVLLIVMIFFGCSLFSGPPGQDGIDGLDGADGKNGTDGAAGVMGPAGAAGADGTDGGDGKYVVGGYLSCSFGSFSSGIGELPASTAHIFIAFDPNAAVADGNEIIRSVAIGDYISGDNIGYGSSFEFDDIPEGDYYVYAWYGQDDNSTFDYTMNKYLIYVYSKNGNESYAELSLNLAAQEIVAGPNGALAPNYTVNDEYIPNLDISLSHDWGG